MTPFDITGKKIPAVAYVWTDDKGNKFLFPSWVVRLNEDGEVTFPEEEKGLDRSYLLTCANVWGCTLDKELTLFDLDHLPHLQATVFHPNMFAQTDIWIIGGTTFDEIKADQNG